MVTPLPPAPERGDPLQLRLDRRNTLLVLVLVVAVSAAAVVAWRPDVRTDPDRGVVSIGKSGDFPAGSVTERVVTVADVDPSRVSDPRDQNDGPLNFRLLIVNDPESGLLALSDSSPFRGCRVVEISAAAAGGFGHTRTRGFERGFLDPCHGGLFALDGTHLGGAGEVGLVRFGVGRRPDGTLTVDLTQPRHAPSVKAEG